VLLADNAKIRTTLSAMNTFWLEATQATSKDQGLYASQMSVWSIQTQMDSD
jgi:hypothetical protein